MGNTDSMYEFYGKREGTPVAQATIQNYSRATTQNSLRCYYLNHTSDTIRTLWNYVNEQEFDTDSICMDVEDNIGNISNQMNNKKIMILINQFIKTNNSMSAYLSTF